MTEETPKLCSIDFNKIKDLAYVADIDVGKMEVVPERDQITKNHKLFDVSIPSGNKLAY